MSIWTSIISFYITGVLMAYIIGAVYSCFWYGEENPEFRDQLSPMNFLVDPSYVSKMLPLALLSWIGVLKILMQNTLKRK